MTEIPYFSVVIWTKDTNIDYFRDCMESLVQQTHDKWELYVLDENRGGEIAAICKEFFPEDIRMHYRRLKNPKGGAYAYNIGFHFAEGEYVVLVGQHDRISQNALHDISLEIIRSDGELQVLFTDHDEIVGQDRMYPHFKCGYNKELLLRTPYIGEFLTISCDMYKKVGQFNEKLNYAYLYEYLLRCDTKNVKFGHVQSLLYHHRVNESKLVTPEEKKLKTKKYKEHISVVKKYYKQQGLEVLVEPDNRESFWNVTIDGSDYRKHRKDYILIREDGIRTLTRKNVERMYGMLKQDDVAVVGCRFFSRAFTVDNCGYIFDKDGLIFPAFNGHRVFRDSYEGLDIQPRDVAMVDPGYMMIDARVYRGLHGLNPDMLPRDAMLDFCIRARAHGYRTVIEPRVIARYKEKNIESTESSHALLMERNGEIISKGDPLYNSNLPVGLKNFVLPGEEEES